MTKHPVIGNGIQDELEFLLGEVGTLANRLKMTARAMHAQDNLPLGGKAILQNLARFGRQTVPQIARGRSSSRQNIQVLVNRLESGGWVELGENPAHKRSDLIQLTERGEDLLAAANEREAAFLAGLLTHTKEAEVLSAGKLLSRLRALLEGREPTAIARLAKPTKVRSKRRIQRATFKPPTPAPATEIQEPIPTPELAEEEFPVNLL
jgi:DNA-binding MarR family transcriptional regulator